MNKRDLSIINDLHRFRVMSRDDIADLYFAHLKDPITSANSVLKRLTRDKQIEVSKSFRPYVYFPSGSTMKRNSTMIPHFLAIVDAYKQIRKYDDPRVFTVEPKYKKGLAEPDVFTIFKGTPFFIEIQRNTYPQNVMDKKIKRYEALYYSDELDNEPWQKAKRVFPFIIMVSDTKYEINSDALRVFQVASVGEFIRNVTKDKRPVMQKKAEVTFKLG